MRFPVFLVLAALAAAPAPAAPPSQPVLRLETRMHTGPIYRAATDAGGRVLATASDDKTVRLWDVATGRLLQVLRPPIGPGIEGRMYAVAVSPDGKLVAAAGWTGHSWDRTHSILVFDPQTAEVKKRISGLPNAILDLAWSRDGKYIAAALCGGHGVAVHRAADLASIPRTDDTASETRSVKASVWCSEEVRGNGHDSMGLDFDRANRLIVTSYDGTLRLYEVTDGGVRLRRSRKLPDGTHPFAARFSPDGSKIAVGFDYLPRVEIVSSGTLETLYRPDTSGASGSFLAVTWSWSADGERLYAGGNFYDRSRGAFVVREWAAGGRGAPHDIPASMDLIQDLRATPSGIVFVSQRPDWGALDSAGSRVLGKAQGADLRSECGKLALSEDGSRVSFAFDLWRKNTAIFDVNRRMSLDPKDGGQVFTADTVSAGLEITRADDGQIKLNGKHLQFDEHESTICGAVARDGSKAVIGSNWNIRILDRSGESLRKIQAPAWRVMAVSVTRNGRFVVAALGDGTLRWYSLSDGKELLAFFPHADRKRWVLWTPSGYYDASPGAEDLIGWHVNRGAEQAADFFPVSRFREQYYRPDVVSKVLEVADEAKAVALANEALGRQAKARPLLESLPPVVQIVSSVPASTAVRGLPIEYRVRTGTDAPVTALRMRLNGRNIDLQPGSSAEKSLLLAQLEAGENEILLFAQNRHAWSSPATVRIVRHVPAAPPDVKSIPPKPAPVLLPRLLVLAVGVADYPSEALKLDFAAKDAARFADALRKQEGRTYRKVEVRPFFDGEATRPALEEGLEWLQSEAKDEDTVMVFLSGHGMNDKAGSYYFLPAGADPGKLVSTALGFATLKNALLSVRGTRVVFVDTCRAGGALGGRRASIMDVVKFVGDLTDGQNGVVVFASSTGLQPSLEDPKWGGSAFATALIEGIAQGRAAAGNGEIRRKRLDSYVSERVVELTEGRQEPVSPDPLGTRNFLLARYP